MRRWHWRHSSTARRCAVDPASWPTAATHDQPPTCIVMRMGMTAAVLGASGYAGGELVRLVAAHPDLQLGPVGAFGNAGRTLGEVHPQLRSVADRPLVAVGADDVAATC